MIVASWLVAPSFLLCRVRGDPGPRSLEASLLPRRADRGACSAGVAPERTVGRCPAPYSLLACFCLPACSPALYAYPYTYHILLLLAVLFCCCVPSCYARARARTPAEVGSVTYCVLHLSLAFYPSRMPVSRSAHDLLTSAWSVRCTVCMWLPHLREFIMDDDNNEFYEAGSVGTRPARGSVAHEPMGTRVVSA